VNSQVSNSAVINNKFKQISPKVELTINNSKIEQKKTQETISGTDKSTLVPLTSETIENSIYNPSTNNLPNQIYTNYNKNLSREGPYHHKNSNSTYTNVSLNQSKIKTSFSVEYTYKIIDLMEKMKNFLIISSQNQALFFTKPDNNLGENPFNIDIPFPTIGKHMKKNLSEDFDLLTNKLYLELNKNNDFLRTNKINRFYKEIDGIVKNCSDLNDSIKNNIFNTFENTNESIKFESTRVNIESIIQTSDHMENLYHKLFNVCKDCLTEIKTLIFESLEECKIDNKTEYNSNSNIDNNKSILKQNNDDIAKSRNEEFNGKSSLVKNKNLMNKGNNEPTGIKFQETHEKTKIDTNLIIPEEKCKTAEKIKKKKVEIKTVDKKKADNVNSDKIKNDDQNKQEDKNKMITEKLEMLKHLKEKKEQILNQKTVRFDENTKIINKTGRIGNNTEIDPSELNENVLTIQIPQSNICEVNKPVTDNNNFKLYTSEEDDNTFQGDSEILLHFDDLNMNNEEEEKEIIKNSLEHTNENEIKVLDENLEKTLNDTIIETGNSFMKNHKRSKSHTIQKQLFTYAIKPK
jgi:hypothetical protein